MKRTLSFLSLSLFSMFFLFSQDSLNMRLIYHWEDTSLNLAPMIFNQYNEIWGWHDPVKNREYAIIGSSEGTHFFDLTDQNNIHMVDYVPGKVDIVIHRDFKNKGHYLYAVSDEFAGSLQIMDMSTLPDSVRVVYDDDEHFQQSHNIWIDGDHLYACIPRRAWAANFPGLAVFDISTPDDPTLIKTYPDSIFGWGDIHDMYSRGDTAYLNASYDGLVVVDFTDPLNPDVLAEMENYPFQGYNHSGWVDHERDLYIMADENHGSPMKLIDVSDFSNLEIRSYLFPGLTFPIQDTLAIPHNPLYKDQYIYTSYYYDGIYIFDTSDPRQPTVAGFYDTYPGENDGQFKGAWGVYPYLPSGLVLVSDMNTGLYVLEFTPPGTPIDLGLGESFSVYPNPVGEKLGIRSEKGLLDPALSLFDVSGRQIAAANLQGRIFEWEWELSEKITPGMYLLRLTSDGKVATRKLIIK